jgi:glyoxylase-like metal-dependent hydrolase (beta-lactamase superfamily II)
VKPSLQHFSVLALIALLFLGGPLRAAESFTSEQVAEHVHLVKGPSGNTMVAADTDGLILIEGVPAELAADYLAYVKRLTGETRIKSVINTHWHPESTGLNATLAADGVAIIAHANTRQWLSGTIRKRGEEIIHTPVPEAELPTVIFYDTWSLPFRDAHIELGHVLQAHTDGDIYAWFPAQNILYTGPAVRSDTWSTVDETTNGFMGGLMDAYAKLAAVINDNTRIIPASGAVLDKQGFDSQMTLYKNLMTEMVALLRKGRSAEEVVIANPAVGLKPEWGDPSAFLDQGFHSFYGHLRNSRHLGTMP